MRVGVVGGGGSLILFGLVLLLCRRFSFGCDSGVGFGVVGGGLVEQGYASLMTGCGACFADCWMSRLVVVGPPWRVSLDNPSCRTFYREPASNGNSSTIAIAREQCQTQIPHMLQPCFSLTVLEHGAVAPASYRVSRSPALTLSKGRLTLGDGQGERLTEFCPASRHLLPCPAMDYLWTPWRYAYVSGTEKTAGCIFCDAPKEKDDAKVFIVHRGRALLRHPECVSLHARARDDRPLRASGRIAEAADRSRQRDDGALAADGVRPSRTLPPRRHQSGHEYRQGRRRGHRRTHSHAHPAALGGRREFRVGDRRDADSAGDAGCDVGEDAERRWSDKTDPKRRRPAPVGTHSCDSSVPWMQPYGRQ